VSGLALIAWGFAFALTWLYERITTAPVIDDGSES